MEETSFQPDLQPTVDTLRRGGVILYPTDTVWGIGCDATNSDAVRRIFDIKHRTDSKALIVLVDSVAMLERYVDEVPEVAYQLIEAAVRPITIVYDHGINLAPELLAADSSVGIRVTSNPFCRELCRRLRRPIVSTSANISGAPAARFFSEIDPAIVAAADFIPQYRRDDTTALPPSSVIKIAADGQFRILRP